MAESGGGLSGISNPSVVGLESRMMGDYHVRFGEHCSRSFGNSLNSSLGKQRVNDSFLCCTARLMIYFRPYMCGHLMYTRVYLLWLQHFFPLHLKYLFLPICYVFLPIVSTI